MTTFNKNFNDMSVNELIALQNHLERIKLEKTKTNDKKLPLKYCINNTDIAQRRLNDEINMRETAVPIFGNTGLTRLKKTENNYYNPYEYGSKQQEFGTLMRDMHLGPYGVNTELVDLIGIDNKQYAEIFPNNTKNVNVETAIKYGETSRWPKQSGISMVEQDRFENLIWDPQDTRHIIRPDGYPQAGINTRLDRMEYI